MLRPTLLWRYNATKLAAFFNGRGWKLWAHGLLLARGERGLFIGFVSREKRGK